jgi:hypothetical protein
VKSHPDWQLARGDSTSDCLTVLLRVERPEVNDFYRVLLVYTATRTGNALWESQDHVNVQESPETGDDLLLAINAGFLHTTVAYSKAGEERVSDDTFHGFDDPNKLKLKDRIRRKSHGFTSREGP